MKKKSNRFSQIAALVIIVGLILIGASLLLQNRFPTLITSYISSMSGVLMGAGIGWFLEEWFRNKYDRKSAVDYMQMTSEKAVGLIEDLLLNLKGSKSIFPEVIESIEEKTLKSFRKKFHLYYSTESKTEGTKKGKLFWNETAFDFTEVKVPGKLKTIVNYQDIKFNQYEFGAELCFTKGNGPMIIFEYPVHGKEGPITFTIFKIDYRAQYADNYYGFMYHIDWNLKWRLSPAILSSTNRFNREPAPLNVEEGTEMQNEWELKFKESITIFHNYPPNNKRTP